MTVVIANKDSLDDQKKYMSSEQTARLNKPGTAQVGAISKAQK